MTGYREDVECACGNILWVYGDGDEKFCNNCGKSISQTMLEKHVALRKWQLDSLKKYMTICVCGRRIRRNQNFCEYCGEENKNTANVGGAG